MFVVLAIARRTVGWRRQAWILNLWGFLDFWVTISLAILAYRALPIDPDTGAGIRASLVEAPLALFPAFAIPAFSCVHFSALAQLATGNAHKTG
ncbi:hypothetical protein [Hyphobacterium sp.]|uniref:hypothetical protein n=1 Tax=Hyphobacterium sp. TaxID=2004662 RepID=UPI003B52020E